MIYYKIKIYLTPIIALNSSIILQLKYFDTQHVIYIKLTILFNIYFIIVFVYYPLIITYF